MENKKEVLKQAILNEMEGYEFYKMYAQKATNITMRELFMVTANEELSHIDFLRSLLTKEGGKVDLKHIDVPSPGIFDLEKGSLQPGETQMTMSALNIAVMMEEKSQQFYRENAEKTDDEELKNLFLKLADWEVSHRNMFQSQYDSLKEDWWNANQFSPL